MSAAPTSSPKTASYGSWRSPITSDLIVAQSIGLSEVRLDGADVYWIESRPQEQGRSVVVRSEADGRYADAYAAAKRARLVIAVSEFSVRTARTPVRLTSIDSTLPISVPR